MKKNTLMFLVLILLLGCASTLHNKKKALLRSILDCEGTRITEYLIYKEEEQFSLRCEEEPSVYIEI